MKLNTFVPSLALSTFVAAAGFVAAGCGESAPERIDSDATVTRSSADGAPIEGRSFTDPAPMPVDDGSLDGMDSAAVEGSATEVDLTADLPRPGDGVPSFIDPNLAAGLREDPGQTAEGTIEGLITFGDLSLLGADIDQLLDYIYKPETEAAKLFKFPETVIEKAGEDRAVVGYMIALEYKRRSTEVISFMLVRDLQSCCFGGAPRPDEWVMVEMEEGKTCEYFTYVPVTVRGTFTPGRVEDEYGYTSAIYNMEASSVERYEAPVKAKR
ncbi:MAG: hypothetical protein ACJA2W_003017 [Planctomycetota bacterium]|jgi:hypothetical protein